MKLKKWEELPSDLQTEEVRRYYNLLQKKRKTLVIKRLFDIVMALFLLVFASVLYLVLAIAIKADSRGPVFFRQTRITQYGKEFKIFKFRTMVADAEKGSQVTVHRDKRITRVGHFIRRHRLDETCQLLNILKGDMTFVGTRPEVPHYVAAYTPEMMATLLLPAGITSLASIYYKDEDRILASSENADRDYVNKILPSKMYYNLKGLEEFGLVKDIKTLFMTAFVFAGRDFEPSYEDRKEERKAAEHNAGPADALTQDKKTVSTISICVVARNEEKYLPAILADIAAQKYDHSLMDVILVDSASTDNTKSIMREFAQAYSDTARNAYSETVTQKKEKNIFKENTINGEHSMLAGTQDLWSSFRNIKVLDNPKKTLPAGWNVIISNSDSDVIARIDAHAKLPADYTYKVMRDLNDAEDIVGGIRPCISENDSAWSRTLLQVESSLFGSSINKSRRSLEKQYTDTVFHGAYRKSVFENVGPYNEKLVRTEDNEMHYRIKKAGYNILYDPEIITYQYIRADFGKMLKQKYSNGFWIGRTLKICPGCISLFHLAPLAFIAVIVITGILAAFGIIWPLVVLGILYGLFAVISTLLCVFTDKKNIYQALMPFMFFVLHAGYGIGTIAGIIKNES